MLDYEIIDGLLCLKGCIVWFVCEVICYVEVSDYMLVIVEVLVCDYCDIKLLVFFFSWYYCGVGVLVE